MWTRVMRPVRIHDKVSSRTWKVRITAACGGGAEEAQRETAAQNVMTCRT